MNPTQLTLEFPEQREVIYPTVANCRQAYNDNRRYPYLRVANQVAAIRMMLGPVTAPKWMYRGWLSRDKEPILRRWKRLLVARAKQQSVSLEYWMTEEVL